MKCTVIKSLSEAIHKAQDQYRKSKKKARVEETDEVVAAALAASVPAAFPSPHAPKLAALSPYDSANSSCCFYEDGGGAASVGVGDIGSAGGQGLIPSCPRSPRCSSSRGSRLSSLAHSHSGSMEMNEASSGGGSACQSRGVSVETMTDLRGSSLSSDEGSNSATAAAMSDWSIGGPQLPPPVPPSTSTSTPSLHQITPAPPTSPRPERRGLLSRSPTPNTLSVVVPSTPLATMSPNSTTPIYPTRTYMGGQSLPNLSSVGGRPGTTGMSSGTSQHHYHHSPSSMFLVPPSRSPPPPPFNQRGISYPPPSPPRSLRRGYAVVTPPSASRNPPLTKTRHVGSVGTQSFSCSIGIGADNAPSKAMSSEEGEDNGSRTLDFDVPVIGGVQTPTAGKNSPSLSQEEGNLVGAGHFQSPDGGSKSPQKTEEMPTNSRQGLIKRSSRGGERQDSRRYHTAGAIDDIKKQDVHDTNIHKRLSWNCGRQGQQANTAEGLLKEGHQLDNPCTPFLVRSFESIQSSSGVSSARSSTVHLPADEEEESTSVKDDKWGAANQNLFSPSTIGGAFLKVLTPDFFRDITSSSKCNSPSRAKAVEDGAWVDDIPGEMLPPAEAVNLELVDTASSDRMNVIELASGSEGNTHTFHPSKADLLRMKDFILTDSSIEASDV